MAKEIKIKDVNGITLKTKNKYVDDNIAILIDNENLTAENIKSGISILGVTGSLEEGITPSGTIDITANGTYDVINYASANVNVANENDLLQKRLNEHNGYGLFSYFQGTSVDDYITNLDLSNTTNMKYMFHKCVKIQTIPQFDTSNVINMSFMFQYCELLTSIPQLNTSNVILMNNMFQSCTNLQTISELNTSNVTNMSFMFQYCRNLQTIPNLDTSNVTNMSQMFRECINLQTIDITNMDKITTTSSSSYMCNGCYSLTKLIIRNMTSTPTLNSNAFTNCYHFTGTVNSTYNPEGLKDGRIYVPDNYVEQLKQATNWSTYADIIVPLSTLQEE